MSDRKRDLEARLAALQLRCAAQRQSVAGQVQQLETRLAGIDRAAAIARRVVFHPAAIAAGLLGLAVLGRTGGTRAITRGILLLAGARRLLRAARVI
jgi:hypothetical protein